MLGAQMQNVSFLETSFTGQENFTGVWYSATNNSLPSNNRFLSKVMQSQSTVYQKECAMSLHVLFFSGKQKPLLEN
jgi:hypothetical protein